MSVTHIAVIPHMRISLEKEEFPKKMTILRKAMTP